MLNSHSQKGMAAISWFIVILLVVFVFYIIIRVFPAYTNGYAVSKSLEAVARSDELSYTQSTNTIKTKAVSSLYKRFHIENLNVPADELVVKRTADGVELSLPFETRVNLFANVDLIISFDSKATVNK